MIIHILKKDKLINLVLPNKINGVYSILDDNNKVLANIEAVNNEWVLKYNHDIEINCNGKVVQDVKVVEFGTYEIKHLLTGYNVKIIASPEYDVNVKHYVAKKDTITIGNDTSSSICYPMCSTSKQVILTRNKNHWIAETSEPYTYVVNRPFRKKNLFHGDYVFVNGLKIIIINDYFIINNPNGHVVINGADLDEKVIPKQQVTPQKEISDDTPLYNKDQYFFKAPRFKSKIEREAVKIDAPPQKQTDQTNPAILQIGPRLTMSITTFYTLFSTLQSYALGETTLSRMMPSLIAAGVMLLSSFLWPTISRKYTARQKKKNEIKRQRKYKQYLEKKQQKINEIKSLQKQILIENNVPLEECQAIIYNRKRNLWERNVDNDDFLSVRLGVGRVDCQIDVDDPSDNFSMEDEDNLKSALDEVLEDAKYIDDCPMDLSLTSKKIVAIVGNNVLTKYFMDSIFLQIMTFHSYTDLKIVTITSSQNEYLWEYLKTLPHSWDNLKTSRYFATNNEEMNDICSSIEKEFVERRAQDEESMVEDDGKKSEKEAYMMYKPYYLIFVDNLEAARNLSLIKKILSYKVNLGFSIIIRNDRLSNLPSECSTFINVDENISGLFESDLISDNQKQFKAELNKTIDMYGCAQRLANIPIQKDKAKYELPSSVSFLSMYKVGKVEQLNSLERWRTNNPVTSLAVPVGINQEGELFKMDAHEKGWGPHGLVAGMTGSGKSEWIITYILSLAVNFHPDEVQFVLIDYKGGGLALSFENKEMGVKLPHLAGTITNLDKSAINRALTSIEAELKRRQSKFNEAREKLHESSINIYKYQQYYRKGMLDEPMSHLFIISDEFAELKSQEPEFLEQLVSTARIGRSLGVHLILATQKPSGVVNEQIWSNSRFHVCLRVQDKGDSNEMIKTPDAAMLKTTGAFYLQVGYNEFYALGQSAWAGAKYYPSDIVKTDIDQSVQYIDNLGKTINSFDENSFGTKPVQQNHGEELLNIVSYISEIAKQEKVVGKQLWLPNIEPFLLLDSVKKKYNYTTSRFSPIVAIGEYDDPALQKQDIYKIDLSENTVVYGETGSGKENLLATIIWSNITEHTPSEVNYYIIDFGAETLRMFSKFPHVGEVAFQDDLDRVVGILDMVDEQIEERKKLFAEFNGNYESYLKESGKTLPRWVVVINAWDIFTENLSKISDIVINMFRDGLKYGISFIISTSDYKIIRSKTASLLENKLVLHQPNDEYYRNITDCPKTLIPAKEFSRGIGPVSDDKYCEFQGASISELSKINMIVRKNAENFAAYYNVRAKSLPKIPDNVNSIELEKYVSDLENVPVGYNFHEKDLAKFNFLKEKLFMIGVDDIKKRINSLYGIINILSKTPGVKVRVLDVEKIYNSTNLDIKLFQDKIDATIVALENDLKSRTMQQDHGITFILSAGLLKTKLKDVGLEHFNNYLNIITQANKSTIVLVDTYERLKKIKVEPWYAKINTSYGIWIGKNISNQTLFSVNPITMEERKLDYDGMAFLIDDSNYTLIKTVLDGDDV